MTVDPAYGSSLRQYEKPPSLAPMLHGVRPTNRVYVQSPPRPEPARAETDPQQLLFTSYYSSLVLTLLGLYLLTSEAGGTARQALPEGAVRWDERQ